MMLPGFFYMLLYVLNEDGQLAVGSDSWQLAVGG